MRAAREVGVVHALILTGEEYATAPVDVYADNLSLYNTLDADGVVQPKEVGAAVQELREMYTGGAFATVTSLRAHGQLADAPNKAVRDSPLEYAVRSGRYGVRLDETDYLTKSMALLGTATGSTPAAKDSGGDDDDNPDDERDYE